jgi:hypothetical protein
MQLRKEAFANILVGDLGIDFSRGGMVDWDLVQSWSSQDVHASPKQHSKVFSMCQRLTWTCRNRKLAHTLRGYMGLVPSRARVGDQLCVLFGGQVSYMLRKRKDSSYEYVGECYIHGLMDGEALDLLSDPYADSIMLKLV